MDLRLLGRELGQYAAETECFFAELGTHPVVAGGGRVAFVEHEIDDLEYRRQSGDELLPAGHLERHMRLGEGPLGPYDTLCDGRFGDQKCPGDFLCRETAEQAKR